VVLDAVLGFDVEAEYHAVAMDHIRIADLVVINKMDLVTPQQLSDLKQKVESIAGLSRIWETSFGEVPLGLIYDDMANHAMARVQSAQAGEHEHQHHDNEFKTWTYCSEASWSFNALQRAVETLPRDIYRAKGIVRLDLETGDYGILQVTGKRAWLKLSEPESPETVSVSTELVLIGKPGTNTNESIGMVFEQALEDARSQGSEGYVVKDLRAFNVVFA
jgi:G3E family GTPase